MFFFYPQIYSQPGSVGTFMNLLSRKRRMKLKFNESSYFNTVDCYICVWNAHVSCERRGPMGYIFSFYKTLIIKVKQIIFLKQTEN